MLLRLAVFRRLLNLFSLRSGESVLICRTDWFSVVWCCDCIVRVLTSLVGCFEYWLFISAYYGEWTDESRRTCESESLLQRSLVRTPFFDLGVLTPEPWVYLRFGCRRKSSSWSDCSVILSKALAAEEVCLECFKNETVATYSFDATLRPRSVFAFACPSHLIWN